MHDVLVVGAGPAGSVAATVLARAGARVVLVDRARFPRQKLCGDSLNPGVLAILRRLNLAPMVEAQGVRIEGNLVTGERGVAIEGRYPRGFEGRTISRHDLDVALVRDAVGAGVEFRDGLAVRRAIIENGRRPATVVGVSAGTSGHSVDMRAAVTIAADGRHSTLAFALGLLRHPSHPRRWAIGAYATDVRGTAALGEMHIRREHYIGVAPLPGGLTNVCLVKPFAAVDRALRDPAAALKAALAKDRVLRDRFADARFVGAPHVLGPLAVDAVNGADRPDGLLLAGDAAGFVDPMTGDGLRFAVRGGELAAQAALRALEHGWQGVPMQLEQARRHEFEAKWRFNRVLRGVVGSSAAVAVASFGARYAPGVVRSLVARAADCDVA